MKRTHLTHPIPPTYDKDSELLILGSFPSVKSRETGYFYGHPQNRFWQVLAAVYGEPSSVPQTVSERRDFLLRHHVAAWDVIASCTIEGSSDSSIRDVVPNDLTPLLEDSKICRIYVNGRMAERLYQRYTEPLTGVRAVCLPSTSPANAAWSLPRLIEAWRCIVQA